MYCTLLYSHFIEEKIGTKYVEKKTIPFEVSYEESGPNTPVFFVLSPGVDPLKDVEAMGKKLGFTLDNRNLHNVSLGQVKALHVYAVCTQVRVFVHFQGQEIVAENALELASTEGHWVILQVQYFLYMYLMFICAVMHI